MKRKQDELPKAVFDMLLQGAWLVGSGAAWFVGDSDQVPNDYDVLVPPERYQAALRCIPQEPLSNVFKLTAFGGATTTVRDHRKRTAHRIDFWPMSLEEFTGLATVNNIPGPHVAFRFHPHTVVRW